MTADVAPGLHDPASLHILNAGFEECEQIIERGLSTFVAVGSALVRIRDGRLYRQEYATFEVYCDRRWGFTDRRARQLMAAAEIGTTVPVGTESQARELTGLSVDQAHEVYNDAAEKRPEPTAADLRAARERLHPRPANQPPRPQPSPTPTPPTQQVEVAVSPAGVGEPDIADLIARNEAYAAEVAEQLAQGDERARFIAQRQTGEVTAPPSHPVADARASVARQPAMLAGKAVERLHTARLLLTEAGTSAQIVADLANDGLTDGDQGHDWLPELDALLPILTELAAALRRRNLRSVR